MKVGDEVKVITTGKEGVVVDIYDQLDVCDVSVNGGAEVPYMFNELEVLKNGSESKA